MEWKEFIQNTKKLPPRKLLKEAMEYVKEYNYALDFGAGGLRDTKYLAKYPFKAIDILDSSPDTEKLVREMNKENIEVHTLDFTKFNYIRSKYNIINAQFSLPFIKHEKQKVIISKIINSLNKNGIFVGNFFGERDAWNNGKHKDITFYSKNEVESILNGLEVIHFKEKEYRKKDEIDGLIEKWHVIEFIARRR